VDALHDVMEIGIGVEVDFVKPVANPFVEVV
jgi:hypothetical protein